MREKHNVLVISTVITLAIKDKVGKTKNYIYIEAIKKKGALFQGKEGKLRYSLSEE